MSVLFKSVVRSRMMEVFPMERALKVYLERKIRLLRKLWNSRKETRKLY